MQKKGAVNQLAQHNTDNIVRYSLLVTPNGLGYDANGLGGDCPIVTSPGRQFTFSVRRDHAHRKLLLAIAWD